MHVRKRLFTFLFAALAMLLCTACGKWDYSREAMKAANDAQGQTPRVEFKVNQTFTSALRAAAEDNIQPNDVDNAMTMDKSIEKLLTSGYRLDVYALRADIDADQAAAQLADEFVNRLAGCEDEGFISMVKADNSYFYMAVLTYKHGGSGSSAGSGGNSGGSGENEPYIVKVTAKMDKNYIKGDSFNPEDVAVTVTMSNGETIETTLKDQWCTYNVWGDPDEYDEDDTYMQEISPENLNNLDSGKYVIKNIKYKGVSYGDDVHFTVEVKGYTREELTAAAEKAVEEVLTNSPVEKGTDNVIQKWLDNALKPGRTSDNLAQAFAANLTGKPGPVEHFEAEVTRFVETSGDFVGQYYYVGAFTLVATPEHVSLIMEMALKNVIENYVLQPNKDPNYKNDYNVYVSVSEVGGDGTVSCAVLLVRNRVTKS